MSTASAPSTTHSVASTKRLLNLVLAIGLADLILFVILIWVAFVDRNESMISVIGPIHGVGFVALLGLTSYGAVEGRWGWWFPGITLITTGPPGSIIGDLVLRKQLAERAQRDGDDTSASTAPDGAAPPGA